MDEDFVSVVDEDGSSIYTGPERRTLVRRRADAFRADVLRKERSIFDGQVVESGEDWASRVVRENPDFSS